MYIMRVSELPIRVTIPIAYPVASPFTVDICLLQTVML